MALNDPLANVMSQIHNSERKGISECLIRPKSNLILAILKIMKENGYIGDFSIATETRGGIIKVNLLGNINKCGVVKPRFSFNSRNIGMFEKRYLPAKGFGLFIVSTSKGVMTHREALEKKTGGKLVAFCY